MRMRLPRWSRIVVAAAAVASLAGGLPARGVSPAEHATAPPAGPSYRVPKVVFSIHRNNNPAVAMVAANGGPITWLADDGWQPKPSPDGAKIAYTGWKSGIDIWVMDADGSDKRRLTPSCQCTRKNMEADWSPDGGRLTFISDRLGGNEVFVMNADGTEQRAITRTPSHERSPSWSPDGNLIAFESGGDIWVTTPYAEFFTNLTATPDEAEADPDWSPDGSRIAFRGGPTGFDLVIANRDGSGRRNLGIQGTHPTWSADGSKLAYKFGHLYVAAVDGQSEPVAITDLSTHDTGLFVDEPAFGLFEPSPSELAALVAQSGGGGGIGQEQLDAARDDINANTRAVVDAAAAKPNALADRTNTYRSWRFVGLTTRAPMKEVLSLLSETGQEVTVRYFTEQGPGPVTTVALTADTPLTIDVAGVAGANHDVAVRIDGPDPFHATRTTYTVTSAQARPVVVAQDPGHHN